MIDVTFTFNGVDLSSYLSTYKVTHEVSSVSTPTTLDGTEHYALRRRPVITFSLIPLTSTQCATVYGALSALSATCSYTDPYRGASSGTFRVASNLEEAFALKSADTNIYYKGGQITLRSKAVL